MLKYKHNLVKYNISRKRVINMPNRDGTGPEGKGPKTGRGLGPCGDGTPRGEGRGRGIGRGLGAGLGFRRNVDNESKKDNDKK